MSNLHHEILGPKGLASYIRNKYVPTGAKLAEEARSRVMGEPPRPLRCDNLNEILCQLLDIEYDIYKEYEREALQQFPSIVLEDKAVRKKFPEVYRLINGIADKIKMRNLPPAEIIQEVIGKVQPVYSLLEQSFAQSRRSRAGGSAQHHVEYVLTQLGYKGLYERQCVLNGTVDFLFPSKQMWEQDKRRCTILSIKRSLRERYKQVYEELNITKGLTVYLMVTETEREAGRDISEEKVKKLSDQNIYLVVRDEIKSGFDECPSVMGFTHFFCSELQVRRQKW